MVMADKEVGFARRSTVIWRHLLGAVVCTTWLAGCAHGPVRKVHVDALERYRRAREVTVDVDGAPNPTVGAALVQAASASLARQADLHPVSPRAPAPSSARTFHLALHVVDATKPTMASSPTGRLLAGAKDTLGLEVDPSVRGHLGVHADLIAPDGRRVGELDFSRAVSPSSGADPAGTTIGRTMGRHIAHRFTEYANRRAGDERLFLTPTPLTTEAGAVTVSDDEALLVRLAFGLTDHLQLDVWTGGLPIPAAGAFAMAGGGVMVGGAAGGALFGMADVGLKWRVLDETDVRPAVAISYDLLDAFGAGVGAGGALAVGNGIGGGAVVVVGGSNLQFNILAASVGKHFFGDTHLVAGTYVIDNHAFLPQKASFSAACGVAASNGNGTQAGVVPCADGSASIDHLPTRIQPFVSAEQPLARWLSLGLEVFPSIPVNQTTVTPGVRMRFGFDHPWGPLALDRVKLSVDLSYALFYLPPQPKYDQPKGSVGGLPWLSVGMHFL